MANVPEMSDDQVRATLKQIEEMVRRDNRAFCPEDIHIQRIPLEGYPVGQIPTIASATFSHDSRPSSRVIGQVDLESMSLVNVEHLHEQIANLKSELDVLYKRCYEQQDEINTLKDHLHSLLTNPVFKRQYK